MRQAPIIQLRKIMATNQNARIDGSIFNSVGAYCQSGALISDWDFGLAQSSSKQQYKWIYGKSLKIGTGDHPLLLPVNSGSFLV